MNAKEFLRQAPFVRLVVPLMVGIAVGLQCMLPLSHVVNLFLLTSLIAFCFTIYRKLSINFRFRWVFGLCINLSIFLLGAFLTGMALNNSGCALKQTSSSIEMVGTIIEPPEEKAKSVQCILKLGNVREGEKLVSANDKVLLYFRKDTRALVLQPGDVIICRSILTNIKSSGNPYEFDYNKYMMYQGIHFSGFVSESSWNHLASGHLFFLKKWAYALRSKLLSIFPSLGMRGDELGVASALIVGDKSNLDNEIKRAYVASGTMHILAVSGMHVAILYWVLNMGLFFLNRVKHGRYLKLVIVLLAVWMYAMITGLSGSVLRAAAMITFVIVGESFNRKANIFNSLAASAFLLLIINPFNLVDVGFQLSYVAVISIVTFYPLIYEWIDAQNKWIDKVWQLLAVTIAAQIVTTPISLYYFHQFPNLFLVSNLLMIPLSTGIMYMAMAIIPFSGWSWAMTWLGKIFNGLVWLLNQIVLFIEGLPFSLTKGIYINWLDVCLLYLFIISASLFLLKKKAALLIVALSAVLLFVGNRLIVNYQSVTSKEMIVYNDKDNIIIQFRDGNSSTWLVTKQCEHIDRFVQVSAQAMHSKSNQVLLLDSMQAVSQKHGVMLGKNLWIRGNYIQFFDKRMAIASTDGSKNSAGAPIRVDYLVVRDIKMYQLPVLEKMYMPAIVIIPATISSYKAQKAEKIYTGRKVSYYNISNSGAFWERL